ncbi:hypothetical protein Ancab_006381 [Ancistrocladus abbreviatus]
MFQIKFFEESSGETIFSRGNDRDRAPEKSPPVTIDGHPRFFSDCRSSGSPHIPTAHSNRGIASLVEHASIIGASDFFLPGHNDEHVFSSAKSPAVGLMEEKIGEGKMSNKGGGTSSFPILQPVTLSNEPQPKERAGKPTKKSLSYKSHVFGLGPKLSGAYRTKPKPSKGKDKSLKKGPNSKHPSAFITRGPSVDIQTDAEHQLELSLDGVAWFVVEVQDDDSSSYSALLCSSSVMFVLFELCVCWLFGAFRCWSLADSCCFILDIS